MPADPNRCLPVFLPAEDPISAAQNADLTEGLQAGRPVVAYWQGEAEGRTRIVVLLGPVPQGTLVIEGLPKKPVKHDSNLVAVGAFGGVVVGVLLALGGLLALAG